FLAGMVGPVLSLAQKVENLYEERMADVRNIKTKSRAVRFMNPMQLIPENVSKNTNELENASKRKSQNDSSNDVQPEANDKMDEQQNQTFIEDQPTQLLEESLTPNVQS